MCIISEFSEIDNPIVSDNKMIILFPRNSHHIIEYLLRNITFDLIAHNQILSLSQLEIVIFKHPIGIEHSRRSTSILYLVHLVCHLVIQPLQNNYQTIKYSYKRFQKEVKEP